MLKTTLSQQRNDSDLAAEDTFQAVSDVIQPVINTPERDQDDTEYIEYLEDLGALTKAKRFREQGVSFLASH